MERIRVFSNGENGCDTIRIPAMVVTPGGRVLTFAEGRKESFEDHGDIALVCRRSDDGGDTWSPIETVHDFSVDEGEPITTGNPCPIVDRESGNVVLLFCRDNQRAYATRSGDDGDTWSEPQEITAAFDGFNVTDRARLAFGPCHGIQLRGGRLIAPVWLHRWSRDHAQKVKKQAGDNGYVVDNPDVSRAGVLVSDDHGRTWQAGGLVPPTVAWLNESSAFEANDGSLVLNSRAHLAGCRVQSVSGDGGSTWGEPQRRPDLVDPTCQGSILKLEHGPHAGSVVFANLDQDRDQLEANNPNLVRGNLTLRLSSDDAATFPQRRPLRPEFSGYSDLAQLPDGRVLCLYEAGEEVYRERLELARFDPDWIRQGED